MNTHGFFSSFFVIGQQWRNALGLFLPANMKQYVLISLNAWLQGVQTFFKSFWRLIALLIGLRLFKFLIPIFFTTQIIDQYEVLLLLVWAYVLYLIALTVRPSMERKNTTYYYGYFRRDLLFFVTVALLMFGYYFLLLYVPNSIAIAATIGSLQGWMQAVAPKTTMGTLQILKIILAFLAISPLSIYIIFFLLDEAEKNFRTLFYSIINGFTLLLYTYPWTFVSWILLFTIALIGNLALNAIDNVVFGFNMMPIWLHNAVMVSLHSVCTIVVWIFAMAWYNTIYIQKAQKDYHLYNH